MVSRTGRSDSVDAQFESILRNNNVVFRASINESATVVFERNSRTSGVLPVYCVRPLVYPDYQRGRYECEVINLHTKERIGYFPTMTIGSMVATAISPRAKKHDEHRPSGAPQDALPETSFLHADECLQATGILPTYGMQPLAHQDYQRGRYECEVVNLHTKDRIGCFPKKALGSMVADALNQNGLFAKERRALFLSKTSRLARC